MVNMKESHLAVLLPQDEEELLMTEEKRRPSRSGVPAVTPQILSHPAFTCVLTVSLSSITLEKKNHQQTLAI